MKTILSSDYFLSRIVKILGEIGFVPGCLILLVLMTMSSFASAHHLPNSIKDHKSFDPTTSFELTIRAYDSRISELTPGLDKEHPHGGSISFLTSLSIPKCHPDEGRISFYPQESQNITGTIYDAGGGIPGVVVKIKGTNIFTITDEFGQFQIDAQKGDILIISYPDYETIEVPINEQTEINLELFPAVTQLEEAVINAGYYTVKDKERTGSIARVTADEIENQPVNNVLDALQGRVPGLDITPTTGLAGGGYTVRIRGQNSISAGNDPLYIIDGVPYYSGSLGAQELSGSILPSGNISPLNTLNPSSIETIEILKDADATAIYGSRGANGVIIITTKNGSIGETKISVEFSSSLANITKKLNLLNTEEYIKLRQNALLNDNFSEYPATAYDINGTWEKFRYTDWQRKFIGNYASNNLARASISGGNRNTKFRIENSLSKETTVFPFNFNYKKNITHVNLNHNALNNKLYLNFSGTYSIDNNKLPGTDLTFKSLILPPNAPALYDSQGELNWENSTWENPFGELEVVYNNRSQSILANLNMQYHLFKNLSIKSNLGYTSSSLIETKASPSTRFNPAYGATSEYSSFTLNEAKRNSWIIEPQIDGTIKTENFTFNYTLGGSLLEQNFDQSIIVGSGYVDNALLNTISAANHINYLKDQITQYRYLGVYSRLNINYINKYFINLTGRRDGSSRFGPNKRYSNFGAVGLAWIFSKEKFLENLDWLNFGKLRASFGVSGNDQIADYQYLDTHSISNLNYDNNIGISPIRLFNPNYAWEKNRKFETSIELQIFKNNINFESTYYQNISDNLLVGIPQPLTTGFNSINANLDAVVENNGWEFTLTTKNYNLQNVKWNTTIQFTLPYTKLKKFDNLNNSTYRNLLEIGYPLKIYKMYNFLGVNPNTGLFEFQDYNGDGIITAAHDRQYVADVTPKFYGSILNSINFKNLHLDFSFQYVNKKAFNEFYGFGPAGLMINQPKSVINYWSVTNPNSEYQITTTGNNSDAIKAHSLFASSSSVISDASFLRLKSISIRYQIPLKSEYLLELFLNGYNLWTITNFKGGDPEQLPGFLPPLKRLSFGFKFQF